MSFVGESRIPSEGRREFASRAAGDALNMSAVVGSMGRPITQPKAGDVMSEKSPMAASSSKQLDGGTKVI